METAPQRTPEQQPPFLPEQKKSPESVTGKMVHRLGDLFGAFKKSGKTDEKSQQTLIETAKQVIAEGQAPQAPAEVAEWPTTETTSSTKKRVSSRQATNVRNRDRGNVVRV